jgi:NADH-quinone oxidoreductase subunit K
VVPDQTVLFAAGAALLLLGIATAAASKNLVKCIMAFQAAVFGTNLALFASGLGQGTRLLSDTFVLLSVLVGASVESVGLAIVVLAYRRHGSLNPDDMERLKH